MVTALSESSDVLAILMPITGFKKGHDIMNRSLPYFNCLIIITSISRFPFICSKDAISSSGVHNVKNRDEYIKN